MSLRNIRAVFAHHAGPADTKSALQICIGDEELRNILNDPARLTNLEKIGLIHKHWATAANGRHRFCLRVQVENFPSVEAAVTQVSEYMVVEKGGLPGLVNGHFLSRNAAQGVIAQGSV